MISSTMFARSAPRGDSAPHGDITIIVGPMFAGKTSEMIRIVERHGFAGRKAVIIKCSRDNRYSDINVVTHKGTQSSTPVICADRVGDADQYSEYEVVGIDEGQFFQDIMEGAVALAEAGKHVVISYLDSTYEGLPFGPVGELCAAAEHIVKLSAICACGAEAHFTKRIDQSVKGVEVIGGSDMYAAVCRACRRKGVTRAQMCDTV